MICRPLAYVFSCLMASAMMISCAERQYVHESVLVDPHIMMHTADFLKDSKEIRLSKSDSCVISQIEAVKMVNDGLLVLDRNQLYLFDMDGNLVSRIGHRGKGHGEYLSVEDFDMAGDKVVVLSGYQKTLLEYARDGKFMKGHALDDEYFKFYPLDGRKLVLASHSSNNTHANFVWYDLTTDKKEGSSGHFDKNQAMLFGGFNAFIGKNDHMLVTSPFDYSVYSLPKDGGEMERLATFDFKTRVKLPADAETKDYFELYESTKNRNVVKYLQGYVEKGKDRYLMYPLFDLTGGIKTCITRIEEDGSNRTYRIGQEEDRSYRYFGMGDYMGTLGDRIIMACPSDRILRLEKERGLTYFTKSGLKQDDNPVVFIYTLK